MRDLQWRDKSASAMVAAAVAAPNHFCAGERGTKSPVAA
jgi:hypothetical protein